MGLSWATQRKPMISVQNRCETSRFRTLRTMWLMPRGGSASRGVAGVRSSAMMPSMLAGRRTSPGDAHQHCTAPAPGCTRPAVDAAAHEAGSAKSLLASHRQVPRRAEQAPIHVQALQGLPVEQTGHRQPLGDLILLERHPRLRTERSVDRAGTIAEIAKRTLNLTHEGQTLARQISRGC